MDGKAIIEIIGYLGSALVVISMLMTSVVRLRVINLIGSAVFTCYALIIKSYPTALMNFFLVGINVYHLARLLKTHRRYDCIETGVRDAYVSYLLEKNMGDILHWFPEFSLKEKPVEIAYLVCCDSNPAGLFLGRHIKDGEIEVLLDYATPVYRDTSVGHFLHGRLAEASCTALVFKGIAPKHVRYMEKVGYRRNDRGEYVLSL